MRPTAEASEQLAAALRLLSLGFSVPDEEAVEQLRRLTVFSARHAHDEGLAECLAELEHLLDAEEVLEELRSEHQALFGGAVRIPPYEGSYEADPFRESRQLADIQGFYRAFGAGSTGPAAERPDHAGCELEFLALLVARRLQAMAAGDEEGAVVCREAEDAFLRDHAGRWLPAFCREVARETASDVFRLIALAGERLLVGELALRGIEPAPVSRRRRRLAVEGDELTCGADVATDRRA